MRWSPVPKRKVRTLLCIKNDYIEYDANRKITRRLFQLGRHYSIFGRKIIAERDRWYTVSVLKQLLPTPTDYNECTEVAREELDNGTRPELGTSVENFDEYDVVFVGCPVWWHTAPMAIWSFLESSEYDFTDKIIVPFCTYSATYREETLAKIVELTPGSVHLQGYGTVGRNTEGVENWLRTINVIQ